MPEWSSLSLFIGASLLLVSFPGPNTIFIVTRSVHQGTRAGIVSSLGVQAGTLAYVLAAASGLSAILLSSAVLFNVLKYAGAVYLLFLGFRTLLAKAESQSSYPVEGTTSGRLFSQGVLVNLLNPKTGVFIFAFLPQFVELSRDGVAMQIMILGVVLMALGTLSDVTYVLFAGGVGKRLRQKSRSFRALKYSAGSVYLGLGLFAVWFG